MAQQHEARAALMMGPRVLGLSSQCFIANVLCSLPAGLSVVNLSSRLVPTRKHTHTKTCTKRSIRIWVKELRVLGKQLIRAQLNKDACSQGDFGRSSFVLCLVAKIVQRGVPRYEYSYQYQLRAMAGVAGMGRSQPFSPLQWARPTLVEVAGLGLRCITKVRLRCRRPCRARRPR